MLLLVDTFLFYGCHSPLPLTNPKRLHSVAQCCITVTVTTSFLQMTLSTSRLISSHSSNVQLSHFLLNAGSSFQKSQQLTIMYSPIHSFRLKSVFPFPVAHVSSLTIIFHKSHHSIPSHFLTSLEVHQACP